MDYRKLIKFGNSSHVISIPNTWIRKNKLKKGDLLYFTESKDGGIYLNPKEIIYESKDKEIKIDVYGKEIGLISKEILAAYINNYKMIYLFGKDLFKKNDEIKKNLSNLMGMEIMEETSDHLVVKDFLDINTISIEDIIKKIDIITRSLIADSKLSVNINNYENIYQRDQQVNKLSFLLFKVIKFMMNNPNLFKDYNQLNLLGYWQLTNALENVSDEAKRISRFITKSKPNKEMSKELIQIYSKIENYYINVINCFYKKDKNLAFKLSLDRAQYNVDYDNYLEKYGNHKWIPNLVERSKIMLNEIYKILKVIYETYE